MDPSPASAHGAPVGPAVERIEFECHRERSADVHGSRTRERLARWLDTIRAADHRLTGVYSLGTGEPYSFN